MSRRRCGRFATVHIATETDPEQLKRRTVEILGTVEEVLEHKVKAAAAEFAAAATYVTRVTAARRRRTLLRGDVCVVSVGGAHHIVHRSELVPSTESPASGRARTEAR